MKSDEIRTEEFRKLVRDALEHLYDTAYLEVHPLLAHVSGITASNRSTRAQELRSLLKNVVEELRPPEGLPSGSPEWRSYLVLRRRYIEGMAIGQVESELGLGRRQVQRESQKGMDALASMLWANHRAASPLADKTEMASHFLGSGSDLDPLEIELNQWQLVQQNCDVATLVNDVLWLLRASEQSHVFNQVDISALLPPVFVDATLTRQALFNIFRLVAQSSQDAISLSVFPDQHFLVIRLHSLVCIPRSEDRAWQAAQRIIHNQGGSLALETGATDGLQIAIRLPLAGQTQVLVIDDNPGMLQLFERYLMPHHYEVKKAQGGKEALSLAMENPPNLIILDVMMPAVDGWQVLRSLKQNPSTQNIPIIICSVLKEPALAISLGASAYLKKPVDRIDLLTTIEQILRH